MKSLRKIMALVIVAVMVVGMSSVAWADTVMTTTDTSTGTAVTTTTTTAAASESFTMTIGLGNTNDTVEHTYQAYQIFDGDLLIERSTTDGTNYTINKKTLSNIVWGSGVDTTKNVEGKTLIQALAADSNFTGVTTAAQVADKLSGAATDAEIAQAFADIVSKYLTTDTSKIKESSASKDAGKVTGYSITGLEAGYYLVKDKDASEDNTDDFYTRFVLEVVSDVTVAPKGDSPSVDKEVQDNETAAIDDEWGETADHAINESFQFRLTATIPENVDLEKYDYYKVVFTDIMSVGVSFDSIDSVKIKVGNGEYGSDIKEDILDTTKTVTVSGSSLQKLVASDNILNSGKTAYQQLDATTSNQTWTLTFNDLKTYLTGANDLSKEIKIQVVYNAHLNEYAKAYNANTSNDSTVSNNKTKLTFSNNPNAGGDGKTGDTPEDTVWVFTYKVDNTKWKGPGTKVEDSTNITVSGANKPLTEYTTAKAATDDSQNYYYLNGGQWYKIDAADTLSGAGFTLYKADASGNKTTTAVKLVANTDGSYSPYKNQAETDTTKFVTEISSAAVTGAFNIKGLDVGIYYLEETTVPASYNKAADTKVEIVATHAENTSTAGADLTLTTKNNVDNEIIDNSGSVLPSTGGRGTTIFYIVGAVIVIGAGILLITRRRMRTH